MANVTVEHLSVSCEVYWVKTLPAKSLYAFAQRTMRQHICELDIARSLSPRLRQLCAGLHKQNAVRRYSPGLGRVRCQAEVPASTRGQHHSSNGKLHVTTPHSGYHFDSSRDQFFEGWYWKVNA